MIWGSLRMSIRISGGNIEIIDDLCSFYQILRNFNWQFGKKLCDNMPPGFLAEKKMQSFNRQFSCLLGSETSPFVATIPFRRLSLLKVSLCLAKPIIRSVRHRVTIAESPTIIQKEMNRKPGGGLESDFQDSSRARSSRESSPISRLSWLMIASASSRLDFCSSSTFSSTVSLAISR